MSAQKVEKLLSVYTRLAYLAMGTLFLALAATIVVVLFAKGEGEFAEFFEPSTLATMRHWCAIAAQYCTLVCALPLLAITLPCCVIGEIDKPDKTPVATCGWLAFAIVAMAAACYGIYSLFDYFAAAIPPDGTPFFVRLATLPRKFDNTVEGFLDSAQESILSITGVEPDKMPWIVAGIVAVVIIAFCTKVYTSDAAKVNSFMMFMAGLFPSLLTGAFAMKLFKVPTGSIYDAPPPMPGLSEFWAESVPKAYLALMLFSSAAAIVVMLCESVSSKRSVAAKVLSAVFGAITGAFAALGGLVLAILGFYTVLIVIWIVCIAVALVVGSIILRVMFESQVNAAAAAPSGPPPEVTTTFTDSDGNKYVGEGENPSTIQSNDFFNGGIFDRQFDGSYKERGGDRVLKP